MSDLGAAIKAKLALKADLASPTFTGTVVMPSTTSIGTVSNTEISYLDGVTSNIQTQLNSKQATLVSATNIKTVNGTSLLGSGNLEIVSGGGGLPDNSQTFTTSGTFTVPAGVTKVYVIGCGGGASGGYGYGAGIAPGGGGSGLCALMIPVTPSANVSVIVGAGGLGGTLSFGAQGGNSSFGSFVFEGGGVGNFIYSNTTATVASGHIPYGVGVNGGGNGGFIPRRAGTGSNGGFVGGAGSTSCGGGAGGFGTGGAGRSTAGIGNSAEVNTGGGGGSGYSGNTTGQAGGNGGSGKVVVYW